MAADTEEFLNDEQVAAMLRVAPRTLMRWRRNGGGPPYVRVGSRRLLYSRADVLAWVGAHTHSSLAAESVASEPAAPPAAPPASPKPASAPAAQAAMVRQRIRRGKPAQ
jgi:DNA-binding transcriptional MerR regulator